MASSGMHILPTLLGQVRKDWLASPAGRYLLASAFVLTALGARAGLDPFLSLDVPFLTFFLAVTASAWYGGLGPGFFAVAASVLLSAFFFIPPFGSFLVHQTDMATVGLFSVEAMGLGYLTHRFHRSSLEARASHDQVIRLVESITEAYVVLDNQWTYREMNSKAEAILGRPAHQLIGHNVWKIFPDMVGTQAWSELHQAMTSRISKHFELYSEQSDRWFENRVYPHDQGITVLFTDITERKRTEQAWHETESRLAAFLEQVPVGIGLLNLEGRSVVSNPMFRRFVGDVIPSRSGLDAWRWRAWTENGQPLDPSQWPGSRGLRGETVTGIDFLYQPEDGPEAWVRASSAPFRNEAGAIIGVILVLQDIDERKRADDALRESEERLRMAMAAGQMGAWDIDVRSGHVTWDAKQYALLGLPSPEPPATMNEFYPLLHADDAERVKRAMAVSELTGRFSEDFRVVRPNGPWRWIAARGAAINDQQGRSVRMVGVTYDVTERKEAQGRLEQFAEELERLVTERTRELLCSQEQLRALATELNLAEQRERKRVAIELHDYLAQTLVVGRLKLGQTRHLANVPARCMELIQQTEGVINEALTYTRTLVAELSPPVLHEFGLPAALMWLGDQMQRHELTVSVQVHQDEEVELPEDQAVLLFQSVRELLMNVAKHAGTRDAVVQLQLQADQLRIEVRDEGQGFTTQTAMAAGQQQASGSKFGLFSIRERMKALGGRFHLESVPGQGTIAALMLPLHETRPRLPAVGLPSGELAETLIDAPASANRSMIQEEDLATQQDTVQAPVTLRVLLVDDHAMVRQGLRSLLAAYEDIDVIGEACNGRQAVAFADTLRPSIVVMDINMPNMNGIEATAQIKARHPQTIVIGLSVNASTDSHEAMKKAGATILLTKEAAVEQLYSAIQKAVMTQADQPV
jgi:PAS domain S-box-containing protein